MPLPKDPVKAKEARRKMSEAQKRAKRNPEFHKKQSEAIKKYFDENPEARKKQSEATKKYFDENPEAGKEHSERLKKHYENPEARKKQSETIKKSFVDHQWYGSIKYYDGPQYCEKWTEELRERVRAYFGYVCAECGTPQTKRKLAVHHVHYNKKLCCDDTPRTLVPLCPSCHVKTNTGDRENWSNHFQDIIDAYYDGKCWFTKEEMKQHRSQ